MDKETLFLLISLDWDSRGPLLRIRTIIGISMLLESMGLREGKTK
jgi:hypothetical protein